MGGKICALCQEKKMLTKHHICPKRYSATPTFKGMKELGGNFLFICEECHVEINRIELTHKLPERALEDRITKFALNQITIFVYPPKHEMKYYTKR